MNMKENERVVVAKPIASRPSSSFKTFTDLLGGAFDASSHTKSSEAAVSAIRPKTVKLSSMANRASLEFSSSQAEISETAPCNMCNKIPQSRCKEFVIHKPLAKLVSRTTISLLENMDNLSVSQQQPRRPTEAYFNHSSQDKCISRNQPSSHLQQRITSEKKSNQGITPSDRAMQSPMENVKLPPSNSSDRPSYDGYNWRKYGQKQVKGSEYPRSYYRCTHPSCPVKKKVERSFDGTIAEIVYKGEHNHSKPQPPTRTASATDGAGPIPGGVVQDTNHLLLSNYLCQNNDSSEGREKNRNENAPIFQYSYQYKDLMQYDSLPALSSIAGVETSEHTCGLSGEYEEASKKFDALEDEPESKRRKSRNQLYEVRPSSDVLLEASTMVQNSADSELLEDGFRWRKYGQKLVKGNSYPRSYYRCTDIKCSARKHVERSADDPQAFLTTYEGKHNHEMPIRSHHTVATG